MGALHPAEMEGTDTPQSQLCCCAGVPRFPAALLELPLAIAQRAPVVHTVPVHSAERRETLIGLPAAQSATVEGEHGVKARATLMRPDVSQREVLQALELAAPEVHARSCSASMDLVIGATVNSLSTGVPSGPEASAASVLSSSGLFTAVENCEGVTGAWHSDTARVESPPSAVALPLGAILGVGQAGSVWWHLAT